MNIDHFWTYVDQSAGPGGCWPWQRMCNRNGYGRLLLLDGEVKTWELAHRTAYRLATGDIPAGLLVLHHCDNPPCCNPEHLRIGTNSDNMRDMYARGRRDPGLINKFITDYIHGERHHNAKLTDDLVREIRRRLAAGESQGKLSKVFNVGQAAISSIALGKTWKHVI